MSAAAVADASPPKKGKKKLMIIGAVVAVLLAGGGGAFVMMKNKAAAEEGDEAHASGTAKKAATAVRDPKAAPTFVPLDTFTVNLADRNAERFAQVGITLELDDPKVADLVKAYMPAVRNNILMALADRTAAELLDREGKRRLAEKIRRETSRALGYDVGPSPEEEEAAEAEEAPKKKRRKKVEEVLPVKAVHFSNFIVQ